MCMQLLAKNMDTVASFVQSKSEKGKASNSILKCKRVLDRFGASLIEAGCISFLNECNWYLVRTIRTKGMYVSTENLTISKI